MGGEAVQRKRTFAVLLGGYIRRNKTMKQTDYKPLVGDDCYQYITEDHEPVKRKIVTAANKHKETGLVLVGARHWSPAMMAQAKATGIKANDGQFEQGFIDQYDQYLSREDSKRIALTNNQELIGEDWGVLFSENLH